MLTAEALVRLLRRRASALETRAADLERAGHRAGWTPAVRDPAVYRLLAEQFSALADDIERADS